jgi:hypothetical protein
MMPDTPAKAGRPSHGVRSGPMATRQHPYFDFRGWEDAERIHPHQQRPYAELYHEA